MAKPTWKLIDSTLREGEQFAHANFRTEDKIEIARALDTFGIDYIELTSPAASPQSARDAAQIVKLGLSAKVITHSRCVVDDVRAALDTGVRGIGLLFATSRILRESSHGKSIQQIIDAMGPPIELALSAGLEVRFSAEDAFRSEVQDLLAVHRAAERIGVHRIGVADTVGIAERKPDRNTDLRRRRRPDRRRRLRELAQRELDRRRRGETSAHLDAPPRGRLVAEPGRARPARVDGAGGRQRGVSTGGDSGRRDRGDAFVLGVARHVRHHRLLVAGGRRPGRVR